MTDEQGQEAFRSFEKMGEVEVRAKLHNAEWKGVTAMLARMWLSVKDAQREDHRKNEEIVKRWQDIERAERAIKAAELAASSAERSAQYTRAAAWASAIAALVSLFVAVLGSR